MTKRHDKLLNISKSMKMVVLFTLFFLTIAFLFGLFNYYVRTGFNPEKIAKFYLGSEEELTYPKTLFEMVEATHVHLFTLPILFGILSHVFVLTAIREKAKRTLIIFSFFSILLFLISPWLIRFVSPAFSYLETTAYLFLTASYFTLASIPFYELLFKKHPHPPQKHN